MLTDLQHNSAPYLNFSCSGGSDLARVPDPEPKSYLDSDACSPDGLIHR